MKEVKTLVVTVLESKVGNPGSSRLLPASIYLISRRRKLGLSLLDVADACGVSACLVGRWYRRLLDRIGAEAPDDEGPALIVDNCVCSLINEASFSKHAQEGRLKVEAANDLTLSSIFSPLQEDTSSSDWDETDVEGTLGRLRQQVITSVQRLIKMASDEMLLSGRHPGPIAAAATHLVIRTNPETTHYANLPQLLELTHSTNWMIDKRTAELKTLLLKAARSTLPWTTNLTQANLEEHIPMIVSHLEVEAKMKAARQSWIAQTEPTATYSVSLPTITSRTPKKTDASADQARVDRMEPITLVEETVTIDETNSRPESAPFDSSAPAESAPDGAQSTPPIAPTDARVPPPPPATSGPLAIKLTSSIAAYFHAPTDINSLAKSSHSVQSTCSPVISPKSSLQLAQASASTAPIEPTAEDVKPVELLTQDEKKQVKKALGKKADKKTVKKADKQYPPNLAPSFVKLANVKARRAEQVRRAKIRLARLAHTLSADEAAMFGLEAYKTMDIDPEQLEQSDQIVGKPEENDQIEKLLMEGVSEDAIIDGYLDHRLAALDSHFNAITEQFTDYSSSLIRSSADADLHRDIEQPLTEE